MVNGKGYVGAHGTENEVIRWLGHIKSAAKGSHYAIHKAIRKYCIESFVGEVIWRGPISDLDAMEIYYIEELETLAPSGYNLTEGGQGGVPSTATRKKISRIVRASWKREDVRAKHKITPEISAQISASLLATYARDPMLRVQISDAVNAAFADGKVGKRVSRGLKAAHKADPTYRIRAAEGNKLAWSDEKFHAVMCAKRVESWAKPEVYEKYTAARRKTARKPAFRKLMSVVQQKRWDAGGAAMRKRQSEALLAAHQNPALCARHAEVTTACWQDAQYVKVIKKARRASWANKTPEERAAWGVAIKAGKARSKARKAKEAKSA